MNLLLPPNIQKLKDNNQIIYNVYRGSYVYGTYIEGVSDRDIAGVYMSSIDEVLGFNYESQVSDEKHDIVFYDIKRFLELAQINNPSIMELMFTPEKFHIYRHPIMDLILDNKDKFLTKLCKKTFSGYAFDQIKKAKGLNKKINWKKEKVERKTVLDYCYVPDNYQTIPVLDWLKGRGLKQEHCGLSKLEHMKDVYAVFYDFRANEDDKTKKKWIKFPELINPQYSCSYDLKYKGIIKKLVKTTIHNPDGSTEDLFMDTPKDGLVETSKFERLSNDVSLSEIPKNEVAICYMNFNKDGYSTHCKVYNEYQEWTKNVNTARLVDVKNHGQQIDGKNMLHCVRLIKTVKEIAEGKGLLVEREDAQELLKIRRGEVDLQTLVEWGEEELKTIDKLFEKSNLPEDVDANFVNDLLLEIRRNYYKINKKNILDKIFNNNLLKSFQRFH